MAAVRERFMLARRNMLYSRRQLWVKALYYKFNLFQTLPSHSFIQTEVCRNEAFQGMIYTLDLRVANYSTDSDGDNYSSGMDSEGTIEMLILGFPRNSHPFNVVSVFLDLDLDYLTYITVLIAFEFT